MADARGAHLDDQVPGVGSGGEDREGNPDLAVVGTARRHRVAVQGEDPCEQVLGGGLPR